MNDGQRSRSGSAPVPIAIALLALAAFAAPSGPSEAPPTAVVAQARADRQHIWWNEDLTRVLRIEGLWSTSSATDVVRMRPERDHDCRIALLQVLTGEVHEYELDREGEVVLAHGWIMVNQRDHLTLGAEGVDFGPGCDPATDPVVNNVGSLTKGGVTWIQWDLAGWERDLSDLALTDSRRWTSLLSMGLVGPPANAVAARYQLRNGRIEQFPEVVGAQRPKLRFRQLYYPGTKRVVLWFCD